MLYITETVLDQIHREIVNYPPERGGVLLGIPGQPMITEFILDHHGRTSGASYFPSGQIAHQVQQWEQDRNLEFKGVIHSHPGRFDRPSAGDETAILEGLNINPHMPYFVAPIVTLSQGTFLQSPQADHELALRGGKLSCYGGYRAGRGVEIRPLPVQAIAPQQIQQFLDAATAEPEVPTTMEMIRRHLADINQSFRGQQPVEISTSTLENVPVITGRLILPHRLELLLLFGNGYPVTAPTVLVTPAGEYSQEITLPWSLFIAEEHRLKEAIRSRFPGQGPWRQVYGLPGKPSLTTDAEQATLAGWASSYSEDDPKAIAAEIKAGLFARSQGLLSEAIQHKQVLIFGTGSVGSYIAEQLTRSGMGGLTVVDPDRVEYANLCRTAYNVQDVDQLKVDALARHLWNINPTLTLTRHAKEVQDFTPASLYELINTVDLVIATTDDQRAQRQINHFAYHAGVPALFVGLYAGAKGGEIILSLPDQTPCYACATINRHQFEDAFGQVQQVQRETDYGTGRLVSEVALAVDIHHVTSAAVKMALALLLSGQDNTPAELKRFLEPAIAQGFSYLTLSMSEDYWFYPQIFNDTPGQYAYQSVWLTPQQREDCPVCGAAAQRCHPVETSVLKTPDRQALMQISTQM